MSSKLNFMVAVLVSILAPFTGYSDIEKQLFNAGVNSLRPSVTLKFDSKFNNCLRKYNNDDLTVTVTHEDRSILESSFTSKMVFLPKINKGKLKILVKDISGKQVVEDTIKFRGKDVDRYLSIPCKK